MGGVEDVYKPLVGKPEGNRSLWRQGPSADDRIMLRYILMKWCVRVWTGFNWLRIGSSGGLL
jgi:hypothetical protein